MLNPALYRIPISTKSAGKLSEFQWRVKKIEFILLKIMFLTS